MGKIVDILYVIINVAIFILAIYSVMFEGQDTTKLQEVWLVIFGAVLALTMVACVLVGEDDKHDDEGV